MKKWLANISLRMSESWQYRFCLKSQLTLYRISRTVFRAGFNCRMTDCPICLNICKPRRRTEILGTWQTGRFIISRWADSCQKRVAFDAVRSKCANKGAQVVSNEVPLILIQVDFAQLHYFPEWLCFWLLGNGVRFWSIANRRIGTIEYSFAIPSLCITFTHSVLAAKRHLTIHTN